MTSSDRLAAIRAHWAWTRREDAGLDVDINEVMVHAVEDIPYLLAEVERAHGLLERARMADPWNVADSDVPLSQMSFGQLVIEYGRREWWCGHDHKANNHPQGDCPECSDVVNELKLRVAALLSKET